MPDKIWLLNLDDFLLKDDARTFLKGHALNALKYIQILKPNDLCVISPLIPRDEAFISYMARIKKIANKNWLFAPRKQKEDESLVEAIGNDKALVAKLKKLCKQDYVIIPLIYNKDFAKLSRKCGNHLLNNSIAIEEANNKLVFKKLCRDFGIQTIQPVFESGYRKKPRVLSFLNFNETYLLRKPFSAGGYGNTKGKLLDLLKLVYTSPKSDHFYIERFKDIYKTLGSLCILKENDIQFVGIDCQIINKAAWEGCYFPFTKLDKDILAQIKEKSLQLAGYYHRKGVRGQVNFDWAIRIKEGNLMLRALECNSRYNGFGLCIRLASTAFDIPREKLHFYLDTEMSLSPKLTTKKVIKIVDEINKTCGFKGGIVLTGCVRNGKGSFCFMATSSNNIAKLKKSFKRLIADVK